MDVSATHDVPHHRLLTVAGVAGIAYTLSWIAGLAVTAPSPKLTASGAEIIGLRSFEAMSYPTLTRH